MVYPARGVEVAIDQPVEELTEVERPTRSAVAQGDARQADGQGEHLPGGDEGGEHTALHCPHPGRPGTLRTPTGFAIAAIPRGAVAPGAPGATAPRGHAHFRGGAPMVSDLGAIAAPLDRIALARPHAIALCPADHVPPECRVAGGMGSR